MKIVIKFELVKSQPILVSHSYLVYNKKNLSVLIHLFVFWKANSYSSVLQ